MFLLLTSVTLISLMYSTQSITLTGLSNSNQGIPLSSIAPWTLNSNLFSSIPKNNENMQMQHNTLAANGLALSQQLLQGAPPLSTMMEQGKPITIPKLQNVPLPLQQLASLLMKPTSFSQDSIPIPFFVAVNSNEDDNDDATMAPGSSSKEVVTKPSSIEPNNENVVNKNDKGAPDPDSDSDEEDDDQSAYYD